MSSEKMHEMHETIFCSRAVTVVNLGDVGRGILSCVRVFLSCGAAKGANPDPGKLQIDSGEVGFFLKSLESSEMC